MQEREALERLAGARVGRLATVDPPGNPHLVPFVFALDGGRIVSAVDHKPKGSRDLARVRNILGNPSVTVLVDHYREDWSRLWWVRADGRARIVTDGEELERVVSLLTVKYRQYRARPPSGPAIVIDVHRIRGWSAIT